MLKANKDLFLTADRSRVVDADDPEANYLLARKGDEINDADARRYGFAVNADADNDGKDEGGESGVKKAFSAPPETKRAKK